MDDYQIFIGSDVMNSSLKNVLYIILVTIVGSICSCFTDVDAIFYNIFMVCGIILYNQFKKED